MVTWTAPPHPPSRYTVSYSCTLLCDISSTTQESVNITSVATTIITHTFSPLAPGSGCTISVVAVYDGIGMSNTLSTSTNTLSLGNL